MHSAAAAVPRRSAGGVWQNGEGGGAAGGAGSLQGGKDAAGTARLIQQPLALVGVNISQAAAMSFFTIFIVISWYLSNIGVLLLNKYLLSGYDFRYPVFLTMAHMVACSILSYVNTQVIKFVPRESIKSQQQFLKIAALSAVFCLSVVGGNVSLRYIPVSFNQAIGATTPFFTAIFGVILTMKWETFWTYSSLIPVVLGCVIASGGEPSFHMFGFIACISATAARALKSVLQGILLSNDAEKLQSMNLLMYMSMIAVGLLLPTTMYMEPGVFSALAERTSQGMGIWALLIANATMAYFANLTNFLVTKHTSALTLQVLGNAKGAVAVVVSILIFRNPVTIKGMLGYGITLAGVVAYSEAKKRSTAAPVTYQSVPSSAV
eukprot:jgi/Chlat1/4562/Chrsp29S04469